MLCVRTAPHRTLTFIAVSTTYSFPLKRYFYPSTSNTTTHCALRLLHAINEEVQALVTKIRHRHTTVHRYEVKQSKECDVFPSCRIRRARHTHSTKERKIGRNIIICLRRTNRRNNRRKNGVPEVPDINISRY